MNAMHPVEGEELQAYLDNELAAERHATVEQHLAACADCHRLLDDLRQVSARLQAWQVEPAPPRLRMPSFQAAKPRTWRLIAAFGGVAAAALLVVSVSIPNLLKSRSAMRSVPVYNLPVERTPETISPAPGARPAGSVAQPYGAVGDKKAAREADVVAELGERSDAGRMAATAVAEKVATRPMIARDVSLTVTVKDFEAAKRAVLEAVEGAGGYVAQGSSAETPEKPRRADLVVRVPVPQLGALLQTVRELGRVSHEQQSSEEVTAQYVDLQARIQNARATEQRLVRVLAERTGKVKDILDVEREIARKREEIERMEAHRKHLENRAAFATVRVALVEEFEAKLVPAPGARTRIRNAFVEGYKEFVEMFVSLAVFFAGNGLQLVFWGVMLWLGWRMVRARVRELVHGLQ